MDKNEALKYIESKGDSKFLVRTEEEDSLFMENYKKQVSEEVGASIKTETHNQYDLDIFEATGLKRDSKQFPRTYDFNKHLLKEFKTKAEKAEILETEITKLKKQMADGTGDKKTLADLEAVQKAYKELEESKTKEIDELKKNGEQKEIRYAITSALSGYAYKKGITEPVRKAFIGQVINELASIGELREGKLVFIDKAGNPLRNTHNALNPYTAKELLDERLKEIIDVGRKLEGGPGIENEIIKEYDKQGKVTKMSIIIPDSVKTKIALGEFLVSNGILRNTPEYLYAYSEYSKDLPIK